MLIFCKSHQIQADAKKSFWSILHTVFAYTVHEFNGLFLWTLASHLTSLFHKLLDLMLCHGCRTLQSCSFDQETRDTYSVVKEEAYISQVGSNNSASESFWEAPVQNGTFWASKWSQNSCLCHFNKLLTTCLWFRLSWFSTHLLPLTWVLWGSHVGITLSCIFHSCSSRSLAVNLNFITQSC